MGIRECIQIFISLFVLVNPLEGIPFLLAKTGECDPATRDEIVGRAAKAVTIILLVSAVIGAKVLHLFGIGLPAFQVGGGIILFLIAVQMTLIGVSSSKGDPTPTTPHESPHDIAIVPLAIPLLAGPGAISGAVLYGTRTQSFWHLLVLCGTTLLVGLAVYGSLRAAEQLRNMLKDTGIDIATRLMGLLIAAIAAQLTVEGLVTMLPSLQSGG
jgi:multiple antibiotic resistance protein